MPRNFFKEKGFSSDDSQLGSGSKPVEVATTVISLPTGILYRKNCEGSLKTVLDCLSMIDDHFLINAKLDVANIYSESKNLAISIASTGKVTIADIVQTTITAADAAGVTVTDSSGDTALIIGESTGAIKVQSIYPLDAVTELEIYNCLGGLCLSTAGDGTNGEITIPKLNTPEIESTSDLTLIATNRVLFSDDATEDSIGTYHAILEENRPGWVLAAGTSATFADVDFSSYVPTGVKMLKIKISASSGGAGLFLFRRKGSSETDQAKVGRVLFNIVLGISIDVLCDTNGIIQYQMAAGTNLYANIEGYYY